MPIPDEAERRRRAEQVRAVAEHRARMRGAKDSPRSPNQAAEPASGPKAPEEPGATAEEPS